MKPNTDQLLAEFPEAVRQDILDCLQAYIGCTVTRWNDKYKVVPAVSIDDIVKPPDFKVWTFRNTDFYTQVEISKYAHEIWGNAIIE